MAMGWKAYFMIVLVIATFTALARGFKSPDIVMFLALIIVWNVGIINTKDALAGFSNSGAQS
jgi:hypothetical protein